MHRDDIIEYSLDAHHSEEEGKKIRSNIWKVAILLTLVTAFEVGLGIFASGWVGVKWEVVKWIFIILTIIKAAYIVLVFMHLGDERKNLRYLILIPYIFFMIYLILLLVIGEGTALHNLLIK